MWREYHEATKHTRESLRRSQHFLDWANMPNPFRHYEGVPVLDLPADPPSPESSRTHADGPAFLSQLLFYSAAVSATKLVSSTGDQYALRVNPSSGNLHPTEFHFFTRGLRDWPDGLYHYRPSSHMAEQRALGDFNPAPITFVLTSIAWREAWKYQNRAYRYCLHDIGHAWQALALAAGAMGCDTFATGSFADDEIAQVCRLNDDEWPMLMIEIRGSSLPFRDPDRGETTWFGGTANRLSDEQVVYPLIDRMHAASKLTNAPLQQIQCSGNIDLLSAAFVEIARKRRSALDFEGGSRSMSLAQLSAILAVANTSFIELYLYVHRVDGLAQGVYRYQPRDASLELIRPGDQRVAAAGLSLGQDLAGNACVAFSMIADLGRATSCHGDRGYRYAHFEAGAIGHRFYLAAEALGLGATGIGAFFDDEVHHYLDITGDRQVVYHFAIGYPVPDPRLEA